MDQVYVMQRANGDCFAHEVNGSLSVPLFHSVHDALMSRLQNFSMMLFKPVKLTSGLMSKVLSESAGRELSFSVVDDPFVSLKGAARIDRNQLFSLTEVAAN